MVRARFKSGLTASFRCSFASASRAVRPQDQPRLLSTSPARSPSTAAPLPYLIRHLPVNCVSPAPARRPGDAHPPRLPHSANLRSARSPENVVHASLERRGSSDWAVLCSVNGTVSLLVFFGGNSGEPSGPRHGARNRAPAIPRLKQRPRLQLGHRSCIA